jgi:hypothetical protein
MAQRAAIRHASTIALVAALVCVVAGCGQSAEEKYASSVCSDIADWRDQVQKSANEVKAKVQSPETGMLAAIDADVQEAVDATDELASNLSSTNPPDTDEGRQAQQQLDALVSQIRTTVNNVRETVDSIPQGASFSEMVQKLAPLAPTIKSLAVNTSSTLASVKQAGSKIKDGFDNADSCKKLEKSAD